ncbi:MAG: DUF503 domain-containing protein [Desulfuromonas sp.]|nr:MAG: DUF503 domain-containing protein [Desulfuromonas sp.]
MVVGVLRLDLLLEGAQSLKEKRSLVKRVLARIRNRYPVSAAEVGDQDLLQRVQIGVCVVSGSEGLVHRLFERLEDDLDGGGLATIIDSEREFIHY